MATMGDDSWLKWLFFCCERLSASMARSLHFELYLYTAVDSRPGPGGSRTTASCDSWLKWHSTFLTVLKAQLDLSTPEDRIGYTRALLHCNGN